jgi:hypothetical protein
MNATDLDQTYRALAQAIDQSATNSPGTTKASPQSSDLSKRELFLAMLSLKLICQLPDAHTAEMTIYQVLAEAQKPTSIEKSINPIEVI